MTEESKSIEPSAGNESDGSQAVQTQRRIIKHDNQTYSWTGKRWIDIETFTSPPAMIVDQLDAILLPILLEEDEKISDVQQLLTEQKRQGTKSSIPELKALQEKSCSWHPATLGLWQFYVRA